MATILSDILFRRVCAFLAQLAESCKTCLRAETSNCDNCAARAAQVLLSEINLATVTPKPLKQPSMTDRMTAILNQLTAAARPLRATEIVLPLACSKEIKYQAINRLISLGKVVRERRGFFYAYRLPLTNNKKDA